MSVIGITGLLFIDRPGRRETIMLTVVLRQKRRFVTPVTPKTPDQSYVPVGGWVDYAEIHDVGQKDHDGFGAACNRNDPRNDRCFC